MRHVPDWPPWAVQLWMLSTIPFLLAECVWCIKATVQNVFRIRAQFAANGLAESPYRPRKVLRYSFINNAENLSE